MPMPRVAKDVLDREFLELRAKILEIAATLDRLDRAEGSVAADPRMARVAKCLTMLAESPASSNGATSGESRAERVQVHFSLPYHQDWQTRLSMPVR